MLEANTILGNNAIILTALKKTLLAAGEPLCAALVAVGARSDTEVKQLSDANVESDIVKAMLFDQAFIIAALAMFADNETDSTLLRLIGQSTKGIATEIGKSAKTTDTAEAA